MCGRFIQISNPELVKLSIHELLIDPVLKGGFSPRYNIAPTQNILAVLNCARPTLACTCWGLIPSWARDPSMGARMINARSETLLEKSSFKTPFRKKRCIIFSDGFYEWKSIDRSRRPHLIRMKDEQPFGMAGLWDCWKNTESGSEVVSSTIITTSPNELVAEIHNRMPAILKPEDYLTWLDPGTVADDVLMRCLAPYPQEMMEAYEVSRLVNSPAFDSPDCIRALTR